MKPKIDLDRLAKDVRNPALKPIRSRRITTPKQSKGGNLKAIIKQDLESAQNLIESLEAVHDHIDSFETVQAISVEEGAEVQKAVEVLISFLRQEKSALRDVLHEKLRDEAHAVMEEK